MTGLPAPTSPFDWRAYLHGRAISDESIVRFGLSWVPYRKAIRIPLDDGHAKLYFPLRGEGDDKKMEWAPRLRSGEIAPPFPSWRALEECEVICEGELDCIVLI